MADKVFNVLFLCIRNAARSMLANLILHHIGQGHLKACPAGQQPARHPAAVSAGLVPFAACRCRH